MGETLQKWVWVTSPGKEALPVKVLAEGKRDTEWIVEEGSHKS